MRSLQAVYPSDRWRRIPCPWHEDRGVRPRTIAQLARTLNIEPAVLTGEAPLPDLTRAQTTIDSKSQLNVRVTNGPRNALHFGEVPSTWALASQ